MTKPRLWSRFGRLFTGLIVVCFFLPFFGVSCKGMDVVTISGADMVGGCKPGGLISQAADEAKHRTHEVGDVGGIDAHIDNVDREPLAIAALAFVLLAFGLAWVRTRAGLVATFVVSLAGLGALAGLYVKVSGEISDEVESQTKDHEHGLLNDPGEVSSGPRFGLFLVGFGLLTTAVLTGRAMRDQQT